MFCSMSACSVSDSLYGAPRSGGWEEGGTERGVTPGHLNQCYRTKDFKLFIHLLTHSVWLPSTYYIQRIMLGSEGYREEEIWSFPLSYNVTGRWTCKRELQSQSNGYRVGVYILEMEAGKLKYLILSVEVMVV